MNDIENTFEFRFIKELCKNFPELADVWNITQANAFSFKKGNCEVNVWKRSDTQEYDVEIKVRKVVQERLTSFFDAKSVIDKYASIMNPDAEFVLKVVEQAYNNAKNNQNV